VSQGARRRKRDRGAAAAEFAVVVPVLLMLVFGIIDFGRMASARISLTAAAQAGAQAEAIPGANPNDAANAVFPGGGLTGTGTRCPATPQPGDTATYTVTYQFTFITPVALLANLGRGNHAMQATGVVPCRA
jgi:Flp pilus assembly protein TadG